MDARGLSRGAYEKICSLLPQSRKERVEMRAFEKDKVLAACAGYLLVHGLPLRGVDPYAARFACGEHGKPYIEGSDVFFNLSHSGHFAVCAISDCPVGVDVQEVVRADERLMRRVCTQREYAYLSSSELGATGEFFRLWTAKESAMKCLGCGLALSPAKIEITFGDGIGAAVNGRESGLYFREYPLPGYGLTACCEENAFADEIKEVKFDEI